MSSTDAFLKAIISLVQPVQTAAMLGNCNAACCFALGNRFISCVPSFYLYNSQSCVSSVFCSDPFLTLEYVLGTRTVFASIQILLFSVLRTKSVVMVMIASILLGAKCFEA